MVRKYEHNFIQLERFAPSICVSVKAHRNMFVWGLGFALTNWMASLRPVTMADVVVVACNAEEVLA